ADARAVLAGRMRFQAPACELLGSSLYADLLERVAVDLEGGGPSWEVLRGHEGDPGGSALALRLLGAVNRLVLGGEEPALGRVYQDPGRDPGEAWREFRAVLERNVERLRGLVERPVQTNEVGRCAALLPGFLAVAAKTGLPLRLLEVGASAGFNLSWDRYRYLSDRFEWGPSDSPLTVRFELEGEWAFPAAERVGIAERRGCDAAPVDPAGPDGSIDSLAYIWPDQRDRVERVRAALEIARERRPPVERASAAAWAGRVLREPAPGRATVLFYSIVEQYLSEAELASFHRHVREAGERATAAAPLAWLRMEPADEWAEVRLATWPGGEDRLLARAGYHGTPVHPGVSKSVRCGTNT
ncbi:MAG TPA: DUF2332 domain-containing protein, partial [Solirubrobacterales bacterium]|nr:DUF2332 domain-containing protein [Solirubrobacterales bacterium]